MLLLTGVVAELRSGRGRRDGDASSSSASGLGLALFAALSLVVLVGEAAALTVLLRQRSSQLLETLVGVALYLGLVGVPALAFVDALQGRLSVATRRRFTRIGLSAGAAAAGVIAAFVGQALVSGQPGVATPAPPPRPTAVFYPARPLLDLNRSSDRAFALSGPIMNSGASTRYGDERRFLDARKAADSPMSSGDLLLDPTEHGGDVIVRMFIRNDAYPSTNARGLGTARDTRVRLLIPTGTVRVLRVRGYISISNPAVSWPAQVEDTTDLADGRPFHVAYIAGSARLSVGDRIRGPGARRLPDAIVTDGVPLGVRRADGRWPAGCSAVIEVALRAVPER